MDKNAALLDIDDVAIRYGRRTVVDDVSLRVHEGESSAIIGRSGSGKSSILSAILGMVKVSSGEIVVDGKQVGVLSARERRHYLRDTVSMVFQHGELIDELAPVENVAVAALLAGVPRAEAFERSESLLEQLEVPTGGSTTGVLSGGERQRVAVARALVTRPRLVLADEPTGSLDAEFRAVVGGAILSIPDRWGSALLLVTHDETLARRAQSVHELRSRPDGVATLGHVG